MCSKRHYFTYKKYEHYKPRREKKKTFCVDDEDNKKDSGTFRTVNDEFLREKTKKPKKIILKKKSDVPKKNISKEKSPLKSGVSEKKKKKNFFTSQSNFWHKGTRENLQ